MGGTGTDWLKPKDRNLAILYMKDSSMLEIIDLHVKDREIFIFKWKGKDANLHTY